MDWNSNLFWCIAGILGSNLFDFIFKEVKPNKILYYKSKTTCLAKENIIEDLNINYYLTYVTIENIGKSIIENKDFSCRGQIIIKTTGRFLMRDTINYDYRKNVYKASVIFKKNNNNKVYNQADVNFDFLPLDCMCTFKFVHTGSIYIDNTLRNGIVIDEDEKKYFRSQKKKFYVSIIISLIIILIYGIVCWIKLFLIFMSS